VTPGPKPGRKSGPKSGRAAQLSVLARIQLGLEALYRVETRLSIDAFLIDAETRGATAPDAARAPREQLLIREMEGELGLALFVDEGALATLERHDPSRGLSDRNFGDFCLAVEGVSHFVYVAVCAAADRSVSPLELELQAEVDKYACCALIGEGDPELRRRLFSDVRLAEGLDDGERARYQTANSQANRYAHALERRFLTRARTLDLLAELRGFYRMDLPAKLGRIAGFC
jgi:hypothetical protein